MSKYEIDSKYEQIVANHKNYQMLKQNIRGCKNKLKQINNDQIVRDIESILSHPSVQVTFSSHRIDGYAYYTNLFIKPTRKNFAYRKIIVLILLRFYSIRFVCEKLHISAHTIQKMQSNEIHLSKIQKQILDYINSQKQSISYFDLQDIFKLSLRQIQRHIVVLERNELIDGLGHQRICKNTLSKLKII